MRKKELLALCAGALVLVLVLCHVTALVTPKQHSFGATWGHFLQEEENTMDVLFIGSSMTYCDIVPAVYWEEMGLSSYVVSGPELTMPMEKYYLKEALKTQTPQAVFFEISAALFGRYQSTKINIGQMPWGVNRLMATFTEAERENILGLLFPMEFYHDRWDTLTDDDRDIVKNGYEPDPLAGYTFLGEYEVQGKRGVRERTVDRENLNRNLDALKEIWSACREEGILPIFYVAPAVDSMPEEPMDEIKAALRALEGIYVLDCNEDWDEIGADLDRDFYDFLHYNALGAEKYTRYLSGWTRENLDISHKGNNSDALWESRLHYFRKKLETPVTERKAA